MFSTKQSVIQILLVACLASVVLAAPKPDYVCLMCQEVATAVHDNAPTARQQLLQLCAMCGKQESVKKCQDTINKFFDGVEERDPEEMCQVIGLCEKPQFLATIGA